MNAIFDGKRKIIIVVMLERHFSWQAQHLVKFWEIAGAQNVLFLNAKCVSKARKASSANGRVAM